MEMNLVCSNKWAKIEKDPMTKDREFFSSIYIYINVALYRELNLRRITKQFLCTTL